MQKLILKSSQDSNIDKATIFFFPLTTRPKQHFKLNKKHFKKFWHVGIIYKNKVYETFKSGRNYITNYNQRRNIFKKFKAVFINNVNIKKDLLTKYINSGYDCATYTAYILGLSKPKQYYPDNIYQYLNSKLNSEDMTDHAAIGAIIRNQKKEILILWHNKFNVWSIPIGKIKSTESIENGLKNELKEETSINIIKYHLLTKKTYVYKRIIINIKVDFYLYEIDEYNGKVQNLELNKHKKFKWISINQLKQLPKNKLSDACILYLEYLKNKGN